MRYKIKLRSNLELAKEVIDVDDMPLKDLIINRKKNPTNLSKSWNKGTIKKRPMEMRQSKKQRLDKVDVLLEAPSTLS